MPPASKYHDVKFFLVAIALISAFNYYLTYTGIRLNGYLLLTYTIDTVQGWLAWWAVRSIIIYLDKKMPYGDRPLQRIVVQLGITIFTGMLIIILLTEAVSWIARGRSAVSSFYSFDIFIILVWFLVINGVYIGMHYYQEAKTIARRNHEKGLLSGGYPVRLGKQNLLIPFAEIACFYIEEGYSILLNAEGKKFFPDKSLDKIEKDLPADWFFRVNRQYIIHRNAIAGFRRLDDGKIEILPKDPERIPGPIPASRLKAAAFRNWFLPRNG